MTVHAMNGTNGTAVLDRVRDAIADAEASGQRPPGRPTLVRQLGVTDHQVKQALAALRTNDTAAAGEPAPAPHQADTNPTPDVNSQPTPNFSQTGGSEGDDTVTLAQPAPVTSTPPTPHQPATRAPRPWPLVFIGLAAAVAVWSGWVGLGKMAGFGVIEPLPGIADGFTIDSAIVLPISVEAYAAYALRVWLATSWHSARTITFARRSAIASLVIGGLAQVAYHLMSAAGLTTAPWWVTMLVALVPVVVLGLASALAKLVTGDRQSGDRS